MMSFRIIVLVKVLWLMTIGIVLAYPSQASIDGDYYNPSDVFVRDCSSPSDNLFNSQPIGSGSTSNIFLDDPLDYNTTPSNLDTNDFMIGDMIPEIDLGLAENDSSINGAAAASEPLDLLADQQPGSACVPISRKRDDDDFSDDALLASNSCADPQSPSIHRSPAFELVEPGFLENNFEWIKPITIPMAGGWKCRRGLRPTCCAAISSKGEAILCDYWGPYSWSCLVTEKLCCVRVDSESQKGVGCIAPEPRT